MTIPANLSFLAPGASSAGVLSVGNGGTGTTTLTGYVKGSGTSAFTASPTVPTSDLTGTLGVGNGGTGATTLTGILKGTGTTAFTAATAGTDYVAPGTATTFTAIQNFTASGITLKGSSTGTTTFFSANASATNYTLTFPAATDTVATIAASQTLTSKTLTDPAIIGAILEDIYTIVDGAAFEINPGNGSIQLITLGASRTPKATNFLAGESLTLMVNDGTAYTITWTDATFGSGGVSWVGGSAPTLATTGYTVIEFWKVSTQVYGALVGSVA